LATLHAKPTFTAVFLRMNPRGLKHVEDVKNWKMELKYSFEK